MHRALTILLIFLSPWSPAWGQNTESSSQTCSLIPEALNKLGPAHSVDTELGRVIIYEDRVSRQPLRGALRVLSENEELFDTCGIVGIVPHRFGLALPALSSDGNNIQRPDKASPTSLKHGMQVDLELELLFNFSIDYPDDWFRDRTAIGPKLKLWWPSGVMLSAQYVLPIRNQLPQRHAEYWSSPYPNVLMVGFRRQVAEQWMGAISTGLYERNRYGADLQLYWMSKRWPFVLGGRVSATGYWSYSDRTFQSTAIDHWTAYLDGTLFLPYYNLRLRGRTGQFIREINQFRLPGEDVKLNPGTSGEITRMFGETEIGLFAFYDGFNAYPGFRFSVPLSPGRGVSRGRFAAYPTRRFDVPYDLGRVVRGNNTGFVRPRRGEVFRTDLDIWEDLRHLVPAMGDRFR